MMNAFEHSKTNFSLVSSRLYQMDSFKYPYIAEKLTEHWSRAKFNKDITDMVYQKLAYFDMY